jgi:predicted GIY-YIG superfamily endonuclease
MWYLYITKNRNGAFYTGITSNLERRLKEHLQGKGGHYTKHNKPQKLLYTEKFSSRVQAQAREGQIKRWSRKKKKALIEGNVDELRKLSISRDHLALSQPVA